MVGEKKRQEVQLNDITDWQSSGQQISLQGERTGEAATELLNDTQVPKLWDSDTFLALHAVIVDSKSNN